MQVPNPKGTEVNDNELIELVKSTSLGLMNKGAGDGTIYACWDDQEIIAHFNFLTKAEVIAEVARLDKDTKDYYDDIMGA